MAEVLSLILDITNGIDGKTLCALGEAVAWPVSSFVRKFKPDFESYIRS